MGAGAPHPSVEAIGSRPWVLVSITLMVLLLLRTVQLLSVAVLLYEAEHAQFARLAAELEAGQALPNAIHLLDYAYQPYAQGTLWIVVGAALLAPVFGASVWGLHAVTILSELAAVALLLVLLLRLMGPKRAMLGAVPWVLAPGVAVVWQLLPFGNHTEFLFVPLLLALFLTGRDPSKRPVWHWAGPALVLSFGVIAYRANLTVLVAFVLATLVGGSRRTALAGLGSGLAALALALCFFAWGYGPASLTDSGMLFTPWVEPSSSTVLESLGRWLVVFPGWRLLPWAAPSAALLLAGLGLGAYRVFQSRSVSSPEAAALRFAIAWALVAFGASLLENREGGGETQHMMPLLYALLLSLAVLQARHQVRWIRRAASGSLVLFSLAGLVDAAELVQPSAWGMSLQEYRGVDYFAGMQVEWLGADDLRYYYRLLSEGRAGQDVGFASSQGDLCWGSLRQAGREMSIDPWRNLCRCDESGVLGSRLEDVLSEGRDLDLSEVGRGAWIVCDRDLEALERTLSGAALATREVVLTAARDEARRWDHQPGG